MRPFSICHAYQSSNSNYKIDYDFGTGYNQTKANYKTQVTLATSFQTFNESQTDFEIKNGIYYIIWAASPIGDASLILPFIFSIKDYGIEWIKINWTG